MILHTFTHSRRVSSGPSPGPRLLAARPGAGHPGRPVEQRGPRRLQEGGGLHQVPPAPVRGQEREQHM